MSNKIPHECKKAFNLAAGAFANAPLQLVQSFAGCWKGTKGPPVFKVFNLSVITLHLVHLGTTSTLFNASASKKPGSPFGDALFGSKVGQLH